MTREEAIIELNTFKIGAKSELGENALDMAIQALSQESITTTNNDEPITIIYPTIVCDDAVSREKILKMTKAMYLEIANMVLDDDVTTKGDIVSYVASKCRQFIDNKVRELPPVTPSKHVNCEIAEHDGNGCLGYSHYGDDFPIKECLHCPKYTSYEEE